MTTHEIEMLKEWMQERFDDRDRASAGFRQELDTVKNALQRVESDLTGLNTKVNTYSEVMDDLRDIRNGFQQVTRVVDFAMSKKTWGALAGAIVVGNWLADHVPMFVGWFP